MTAGVAAGHPLVTRTAAQILRQGGNAFDACIGAGFMSTVAEPALNSLGGGGFLLSHQAGGPKILFDFFTDTPGKGVNQQDLTPHFFPVTVGFGGSNQDFHIGIGSVAVPGNLKGFLHVHKRLGSLPLADIIRPAMLAAGNGIIVSQLQAYFLKLLTPIMTLTENGRKIYAPDDHYLTAGSLYKNEELANFLGGLGSGRDDDFYSGNLASAIVSDMQKGQGLITGQDLAEYRVIERKPLKISYRNRFFYTNPPPSLGGTLINATLKLLEQLLPPEIKWFGHDHLSILTAIMIEIETHRETLCRMPDTSNWQQETAIRLRTFSRGTTHISVRDDSGNVASMTCSNGEGSGYMVPETGIMLNNMMGEDDLHPDGFHASQPGLRVASMMSPALLSEGKNITLVLGSGGSKRIRTAIFQVLSHVLDFGRTIEEAVNAPRLHWDGETLQIEPGIDPEVIQNLHKKWPVNLWPGKNVYFGGVHALTENSGAGDLRRDGEYQKI